MSEQLPGTKPSARILKVGLFLPSGTAMQGGATAGWADLLALARRAEELGFDSLWLPDHVLLQLGEHRGGAWECWSLLSALAAATSHVELGPLVSCTAYRNPAMLAKIADTVDEISGGRVILGLGAGWAEDEFRAFDFPFDHRVSRFEEAIQIISGLLHRQPMGFQGSYHTVRDAELLPPGPRPQGPPVMVGTSGPRMLRLTARYADAWNADFGSTPESIRSLTESVDAACRDVGRDPTTLRRSASLKITMPDRGAPGDYWVADVMAGGALSGSPEELAATLRDYAAAGISHVQVWLDPATIAGIEAFAPVLGLLQGT